MPSSQMILRRWINIYLVLNVAVPLHPTRTWARARARAIRGAKPHLKFIEAMGILNGKMNQPTHCLMQRHDHSHELIIDTYVI